MRSILAVVMVSLLVSACSSLPSGDPASSPSLTVLYQQGREGQLEPCGCHTTPYGGIDREKNANEVVRQKGAPVLFVDAGNLFFTSQAKAPIGRYRERSEMLTDFMNELGLDVFAPGPTDFALGLDTLKKIEKRAKFKFVSTNVVDASGKTVFPKFQKVKSGPYEVVVVSAYAPTAALPQGLKVVPAKEAIEAALKEAGPAQLVVALSQQNKRDLDRKLVAQLPAVQVWIANDPDVTSEVGEMRRGSVILDGHRFGYYLGQLNLSLAMPVKGLYSKKALQMNQDVLKGYETALSRVTDPKRKAALEKRIADIKKDELLAPIEGGSLYENELIALDAKRFGTPNSFTERMAAEKDRVHKAAIDASKK